MAQSTVKFPQLYVQFTELGAETEPGHNNRTRHIQWLPPECPQGFWEGRQSPWYILDPSSHSNYPVRIFRDDRGNEQHKRPGSVEHYDITSMFFSTELNSFWEMPYHCKRGHAGDDGGDEGRWDRISFDQDDDLVSQSPNRLWRVGHGHPRKQMGTGVFLTNSWNTLLLPGSFERGVQGMNSSPTCELAGRLTMLLGLIAFTTKWDGLLDVLVHSFRPGGTSLYVPAPSNGNEGRIHKRGLVIEVAFDPKLSQRQRIHEWEQGHHGPILSHDGRPSHQM